NYDKKPLRINFEEKQNILGLNEGQAYKNWVLLAEYKDASMLRNKSALEMSREILGEDGLYASDAAFVEVNINNEYFGVYLLTELQQVNEGRIEITDVPKDSKNTDIGYLLEFDGNFFYEDPLNQFHVDYHNNAALKPFDGNDGSGKTMRCLPLTRSDRKKDVGFTIKSDINSQEQHDFIASYVNNVYFIMYEAAYYDKAYVFTEDYSDILETDEISPREAVERVVDVQSLADMYLISELTCDADLYWSSFFMTADFGEGGSRRLTFQAPWDFDSAMGNKSRCPDGTGFYAANIMPDVNGDTYETINPWLAVLSYEDWYQEIIREKWTKVYDRGVFEKTCEMIRTDSSKYREAFLRNTERWGISTNDSAVTGELSDRALSCKTQSDAADFLEEWLRNRAAFMNEYWHK
ncbi:MAG: CotH kinase family protein, partial [Huintestinicola sp.]